MVDGKQMHEVDAILDKGGKLPELRAKHPALAALTDNELRLAILGLGLTYGEKGVAGPSFYLPDALARKYAEAGFMSFKNGVSKVFDVPKGPAAELVSRTLLGEVQFLSNARPATFFEGGYEFADGDYSDLRQITRCRFEL